MFKTKEMGESIEILSSPKAKTLWKFVVKATDIDDALRVVQNAYPELKITKESIITYTVHKPSEQLKLF